MSQITTVLVLMVCALVSGAISLRRRDSSCPTPPAPQNGRVDCDSWPSGKLCIFKCKVGYTLNGRGAYVCPGTSDFQVPTCENSSCPTPAAPQNGRVNCDSWPSGKLCIFNCKVGYTLNGSGAYLCPRTSDFQVPTCEKDN